MAIQLEHRTFPLEVRDMSESTGRMIGYTAVFDHVLPYYDEVVERGAFAKTLSDKGQKRRLLADHSEWIGHVVGAEEDRTGLLIELEVLKDDVQRASEYWALSKHGMQHGLPAGLSQGFRAVKEKFDKNIRRLLEINWIESSLTPFQASEPSYITQMRSLLDVAQRKQLITAEQAEALANGQAAEIADEPGLDLHSIYEALTRLNHELRA